MLLLHVYVIRKYITSYAYTWHVCGILRFFLLFFFVSGACCCYRDVSMNRFRIDSSVQKRKNKCHTHSHIYTLHVLLLQLCTGIRYLKYCIIVSIPLNEQVQVITKATTVQNTKIESENKMCTVLLWHA